MAPKTGSTAGRKAQEGRAVRVHGLGGLLHDGGRNSVLGMPLEFDCSSQRISEAGSSALLQVASGDREILGSDLSRTTCWGGST